jgi:hypothetical protein
MPLDLTQDYFDSTSVSTSRAPSVESFSDGVTLAHHLGYAIFVVPHLDILNGNNWAGDVTFDTQPNEDAWFNNYWQALKPYAMAVQAGGANQFSIGTEMQALQYSAVPSSWDTLIARIKTVFHGKIAYDTSWSLPYQTPPRWWRNPSLGYIGISCYYPVSPQEVRLSLQQFKADFRANVLPYLDHLSRDVGWPIVITEKEYRDDSYPGYNPWDAGIKGARNEQAQADAYEAALSEIVNDNHIAGVFVWGWSNTGLFDIQGTRAVEAISKIYNSSNL